MTTWSQLRAMMAGPLPKGFPADTVALFPPRDNAEKALRLLLGAAKVSVNVSMFAYCDNEIDQLLHIAAATPAIAFQLLLDESQSTQEPSEVKLLAGWQTELGKRVAVGRSEKNQIIHRKIAVIDHLYVIGGSTNWTVSGQLLEDNELVITRSAPLAAWYEQVLDANFVRVLAKMQPQAAAA